MHINVDAHVDAQASRQVALKLVFRSVPARQIREVRVDSLLVQAGRRATEVMKRVTGMTYGDLNAPPKDNCFQKFLRHNHELESNTLAFRAYSVKADDPVILRGCYRQLRMEVPPPKPCVEWTYLSGLSEPV